LESWAIPPLSVEVVSREDPSIPVRAAQRPVMAPKANALVFERRDVDSPGLPECVDEKLVRQVIWTREH
jgi:hypothetical protein